MATRYTDEFRRDAVHIAPTSGLTRPQVSSDLDVGLSTLNKWVQKRLHDDLMDDLMIVIVAPVVRATMAMP
jgi:transposase